MNKIIITLALTFVYALASSQTDEEKVKTIRKRFQKIESYNLKNRSNIKHHEFVCEDREEEGTIKFFYNKDSQISNVEVVSIIGGENVQSTMYYLWEKKLFFVFRKHRTVEYGIDENYTNHYTENRTYFFNEQAFKCLEKYYTEEYKNSKVVKPESIPNKEVNCAEEKELLETLKLVLKHEKAKETVNICIR